jgi:hypothetical protein
VDDQGRARRHQLDLFAVLLGGVTALLPVYARDILHVGPEGFGILRAAPSAGAIVTGLVLAARPLKTRASLKMFAAVGIYGLSTLVFALSRSMVLSAAALAVLGAADMVSVFVRQTLVQIVTSDSMRGRVSAVSSLFIGASNELGEFESGSGRLGHFRRLRRDPRDAAVGGAISGSAQGGQVGIGEDG